MPRCFDCTHWRANFDPLDGEGPEDILGDCLAMADIPLPYSWRWCPREVVGTTGAEGETCPVFKPKGT